MSQIDRGARTGSAPEPAAGGGADRLPGGCLCGAVRFRVTLPSRFCAHCHCSNCRRAHGAAFVTWAGFPEAQLEILRGDDVLGRYKTDTGAVRTFCGTCGSTLFYAGPRWPGEVHVARALIEGELDRSPGAHVFVDHRAPWWTIDDGLPKFGGESGTEPR